MEHFWEALSSDRKAKELDLVLASAWFIEAQRGRSATVDEVCDALRDGRVRLSINRHRLRNNLKSAAGVSLGRTDEIMIARPTAKSFEMKYGDMLGTVAVSVIDTILVTSEFAGDRPYIQNLVRQINGARQQDYFEACAVLMRRLVETLAIDRIDRLGRISLIQEANGDLKALSGIVAVVTSGQAFKLGRGMDKVLTSIKQLGDRAAHSRHYMTTKLDIDNVAADFRCLVSELRVP